MNSNALENLYLESQKHRGNSSKKRQRMGRKNIEKIMTENFTKEEAKQARKRERERKR